LIRWYQRAEALILPSRYEALGAVILEAMALRLPVIATDIGAVSTVIDGSNGAIVAPGSPAALAQAIASFFALDPEARRAMGANARATVEARFGWDTVGRRTLAVFEALANGRPVGARALQSSLGARAPMAS
jgi:glycosyltransferase involved in cell wall biosynthesis